MLTAKSITKASLPEVLELKGIQDGQHAPGLNNNLMEPRLNVEVNQKDIKRDQKTKKSNEHKASSQETTCRHQIDDKAKYLGVVDLQDSDNEEISYRRAPQQKDSQDVSRTKNRKKTANIERQESPAIIKFYERVSITPNNGIGNWRMNPAFIDREFDTKKQKKENEKEINSSNIKPKKSTSQSVKNLAKSKKNSKEKLTKVDIFSPNKRKKS